MSQELQHLRLGTKGQRYRTLKNRGGQRLLAIRPHKHNRIFNNTTTTQLNRSISSWKHTPGSGEPATAASRSPPGLLSQHLPDSLAAQRGLGCHSTASSRDAAPLRQGEPGDAAPEANAPL
ncbi:unnamed protein product [Pleuronectes platessa]|uniref:Uncharacterized protein n=1 Tax=Pleuronectes platessa TaxID=8262 RepID=A0A9N7UV13_PLEPL|nr:unnamed protein product [Pleuronectes platessa]